MKKWIALFFVLTVLLALFVSCKPSIDQIADAEYVTRIFPGYSYTGIPVVYIETPSRETITREEYIKDSSFLIAADTESDVKTISIKGRGNYSWGIANKQSFNIKFGEKTSVLGMKEAKKWSLVPNFSDYSLLRNWLASYLMQTVFESAEWTPSYRFFDLVLNGEYLGTYTMAESIQINKNRVNIKNIEDYSPDEMEKGGFILEIDFRKDSTWWFTSDVCNLPFTLKDPDFDHVDASVYVNHMKSIIDSVEAELSAEEFAAKDISQITGIDVNSFIDWYIIEEFAKNVDSDFYSSVYMYYNPKDKKVHMGPIWDFDFSFGNREMKLSGGRNCADPEGFWVNKSQGNSTSWYEYLLSNDSFVSALKARWREIRDVFSENTA